MLKIGDTVPELELTDSEGKIHTLDNLKGHTAVGLYFYPIDFTSVCTAQACHFRDHYAEIRSLGGELLGVSKDGDASHNKFIKRHRLPFPLIVDHGKKLAKRFGVLAWHRLFYQRVTFIIRPTDRMILDVIHAEKDANIHGDRLIERLRSMKTS